MYLSTTNSKRLESKTLTLFMVEGDYKDLLGVFALKFDSSNTLYLDFESAEMLRDQLTKIIEEYLSTDVVTFNTDTLDPREVE